MRHVAALVGVLAVNHGLRLDLVRRLGEADFWIGIGATSATGVLAAIAAFLVSLPDRSRWWLLLPLPAALVWVSNIAYQSLTDWVAIGPGGISLGETADCFATLVLIGLPLSLASFVMLRHAVHFNLTSVTMMASMAVSGIAAAGMSLLHPLDASILILIFNLGSGVVFVAAGLLMSMSIRLRQAAAQSR